MSLPMLDACDGCRPDDLQRRLDAVPLSTLAVASAPFVFTCVAAALLAQQRLYPLLRRDAAQQLGGLPVFTRDAARPAAASYGGKEPWRMPLAQRVRQTVAQKAVPLVFSASIGLSAVLVELLLCEISNTLHPAARGLALRVTLTSLLVLNILVTPALEIRGLAKTVFGGGGPSPAESTSTGRTKPRFQRALEAALFAAWLFAFWYMPQASLLRHALRDSHFTALGAHHGFVEACLERIGIIGIALMASLAGFAAVSSLWQTFGVRHRPVRDADIATKESGLAATDEMLGIKQSRLRALQRKMTEATSPAEQPNFVGRVIGSLRGGNADVQELKSLQMEVSGLDTMRFALSSSLANLKARHAEQARSRTALGKLLNACNTVFALYCAYRIGATSLSSLRRWWQPTQSFATSDPINNVLALLTTHWDSNLDRAAWSHQISFLLSGIMLLASFNAVLQTFRLFARFAPSLVHHAQTSLPLLISQIAGTYVISSALLLRSNLPEEVGGVISEALDAPLESRFVESWFESWFLITAGMTVTGILVGRKMGGGEDWDAADDDGFETGKRS